MAVICESYPNILRPLIVAALGAVSIMRLADSVNGGSQKVNSDFWPSLIRDAGLAPFPQPRAKGCHTASLNTSN